jgi:hypothetical protein
LLPALAANCGLLLLRGIAAVVFGVLAFLWWRHQFGDALFCFMVRSRSANNRHYSMTSLARPTRLGGTVRPSALAVLR